MFLLYNQDTCLQNVTKTTQSAYMNDKLHKSNKLREINDIHKPSLSV